LSFFVFFVFFVVQSFLMNGNLMVKIGNKVPKLAGETNGGGKVKLGDYAGKYVVVYFYPKDNTTGCTLEAQGFRDAAKDFAKRNAVVLGVSRDSVKSHDGFIAKHALNFDLVADADETWCKAFDVIAEKTLYGRKYLGVVRSTFLIGPDGRLLREWRNVKVPGHVAAVLAALDEARAAA
jgi:peroxiredoxin Q/BCP